MAGFRMIEQDLKDAMELSTYDLEENEALLEIRAKDPEMFDYFVTLVREYIARINDRDETHPGTSERLIDILDNLVQFDMYAAFLIMCSDPDDKIV